MDMEEKLWRLFENINYWLEYAERKNTIILTLIGIQITLGKIFIKSLTIDFWLIASFLFLALCFILALISFFPKTAIAQYIYFWPISSNHQKETDNLLFYGHITKYSVKEYIEKMEKYFNGKIRGHKNLEDLCNQIVVNSHITSTKFNIFKVNTWFMIIGQILLLISFWR